MSKKRIYIRDDGGHAWYWADGRIKCVGDKTPDGGYFCDGLEEGVALLNQYGYITLGNQKAPNDNGLSSIDDVFDQVFITLADAEDKEEEEDENESNEWEEHGILIRQNNRMLARIREAVTTAREKMKTVLGISQPI